MKKVILLIFAVIISASCKHTQSLTTTKESIRVDTFIHYKELVRTLPQKDSIVIFNPCDSTGIINHFYAQISIPHGKVNIQTKGRNIIASVVSSADTSVVVDSTKIRETSKSTSTMEKIVVKNVIPTWIIVTLFFESMIILIYLYFKIMFPK